jgi:hypothetical protein
MLMTGALRPLPLPHQSRGLLWMLRASWPCGVGRSYASQSNLADVCSWHLADLAAVRTNVGF